MSEKFIPGLLFPPTSPRASFEVAWPSLTPKGERFSFHPDLKDLEAKLFKEVREKALLMEKEAYEKGFQQGERDGKELGLKRLEKVIHQLENVLSEMERQKREAFQAYEGEMVRLMLGIGKRLFRRATLLHEEAIVEVLRDAFRYVTDRGEIILRLHPADYQYLMAHSDQVPVSLNEKDGLRIIQDPAITRGGCLLSTSFGEIDATFESQFEAMASRILQQMETSENLSGS